MVEKSCSDQMAVYSEGRLVDRGEEERGRAMGWSSVRYEE